MKPTGVLILWVCPTFEFNNGQKVLMAIKSVASIVLSLLCKLHVESTTLNTLIVLYNSYLMIAVNACCKV